MKSEPSRNGRAGRVPRVAANFEMRESGDASPGAQQGLNGLGGVSAAGAVGAHPISDLGSIRLVEMNSAGDGSWEEVDLTDELQPIVLDHCETPLPVGREVRGESVEPLREHRHGRRRSNPGRNPRAEVVHVVPQQRMQRFGLGRVPCLKHQTWRSELGRESSHEPS